MSRHEVLRGMDQRELRTEMAARLLKLGGVVRPDIAQVKNTKFLDRIKQGVPTQSRQDREHLKRIIGDIEGRAVITRPEKRRLQQIKAAIDDVKKYDPLREDSEYTTLIEHLGDEHGHY